MAPTRTTKDDAPDGATDEWTTEDPGEQRDPVLIAQGATADSPDAGTLKVEATAYVTIGNETFGPTEEGKTIKVPDNAESRSALAAGFLRFPEKSAK